jgi:hypothetical protein
MLAVLGLALLISGCGSAGSSTGKSAAGAATGSTGTDATAVAVADRLAVLREILPHTSAKLPSPSRSTAVEREFLIAIADDTQRVWRRYIVGLELTNRDLDHAFQGCRGHRRRLPSTGCRRGRRQRAVDARLIPAAPALGENRMPERAAEPATRSPTDSPL